MKKILLITGMCVHGLTSASGDSDDKVYPFRQDLPSANRVIPNAQSVRLANEEQAFPPAPPLPGEEMNRILVAELVKMNEHLKNGNTVATQVGFSTIRHQSTMESLKRQELNNNPVFLVTQCLCLPFRHIDNYCR